MLDHTLEALAHAAGPKFLMAGIALLTQAHQVMSWVTGYGFIWGALVTLMADWVSGVVKAWVLGESNGTAAVRGATKAVVYFAMLLLTIPISHLVDGLMGPDAFVLWAATAIIYGELLSTFENLKAIATAQGVEVPLLEKVITALRMKQGTSAEAGGRGPE